MKNILVIGANSFLSREIIQRLSPNNNVTGIYNINTNKLIKGVEYLPSTEVNRLGDHFDIVFLISAYVPGREKPVESRLLDQVNVELTGKICRQFRKAKIVYAGAFEGAPSVPEYGESKLKGEIEVSKHEHYCIVRISSMYGRGMNTSTFLPRIVDSALKNKHIRLFGDGSRRQNYIHVSDVAEIFIRASELTSNDVFFAVAEQSDSNSEIASIIKNNLPDISITFEGTDGSASFIYDGGLTYQTLNFKPVVTINEGIKELISWQKEIS